MPHLRRARVRSFSQHGARAPLPSAPTAALVSSARGGGRCGAGRGRLGSLSRQGTSARVLEAVSCLEVVERERGLQAEAVSGMCLAEDGTTICATSGTHLKVHSSRELPRSPMLSHDLPRIRACLQCQTVLLRLSQSVRRDSQTSRAMSFGSIVGSGAHTILGVSPKVSICRL